LRESSLVVEVDGDVLHAHQGGADARRDEKLRRAGFRVLRIPASVVERDLARVGDRGLPPVARVSIRRVRSKTASGSGRGARIPTLTLHNQSPFSVSCRRIAKGRTRALPRKMRTDQRDAAIVRKMIPPTVSELPNLPQ
jgi:hypothetical protein